MRAGTRRVALVCPFNLDRLSGTPVRAKAVADCLSGTVDSVVLATGGVQPPNLIPGAWRMRDGAARFNPLRYALDAYKRLREVRPDVLHVMTTGAVPAAFVYKLRHPRCRIIFESHGLMRYEMTNANALPRAFYAALDRLGALLATWVIVMSHTQKEVMQKLRMCRSDKMVVIWGPVDTEAIRPIDPPPDPPLRVGYLGNDFFWQGIDIALAAAEMLASSPGISFEFAGFDRSEEAGPNVSIQGNVSVPDGIEFLGTCHLLLSPRIGGKVTETQYPHKLSYYLAAGRPVLVSDVSDQARIVTAANCGTVVPPADAAALATAVKRFSELHQGERSEMGKRARAFAEEHLSLRAVYAQLTCLYGLKGDGLKGD